MRVFWKLSRWQEVGQFFWWGELSSCQINILYISLFYKKIYSTRHNMYFMNPITFISFGSLSGEY
jgi:hypothetical protein